MGRLAAKESKMTAPNSQETGANRNHNPLRV
jgi:hypothetical protein